MTHLVEIRIDPARMYAWADNIGIARADEDYIIHSILCAAYGDLRPRPFVSKPGGRTVRILGYCSSGADDLRSTRQATADPEVDIAFVSEASKQMPARWRQGQRFSFELRVAPTRRRKRDGAEVDEFSLAEEGQGREDAYLGWLTQRLGGKASLWDTEIISFRKIGVTRRCDIVLGQKRKLGKGITLPDVTFKGTIEVIDQAGFSDLISNGIGRHKAFGFGALMLRPTGS